MTDSQDIYQIADMLRKQVDEKKFLDVGMSRIKGTAISKHAFHTALTVLKDEGYQVHFMRLEHMDTVDNASVLKVLVGPDVTEKDTFINRGNIHPADLNRP